MTWIELIDQPRNKKAGEKLAELLNLPQTDSFDTFYFMAAYVKKSGVIRLQPYLQRFRQSGGHIKGIVGIDQKNTSQQGLQMLLPLCDELYVYHSESITQTFHPKIYFFEKNNLRAIVIVGSSNLTAGGLYTNYEINCQYDFDLTNQEQLTEYSKYKSIFSSYSSATSPCCKCLSPELLNRLIQKNYLGNEEVESGAGYGSRFESQSAGKEPIFGSESFRPPPVTIIHQRDEQNLEVTGISSINRGFWKKLSKNDVSQTSSPGQIVIPIQFLTYFPPFSDWVTTESDARQADVFFNIIMLDSAGEKNRLNNVRAIHYLPAPTHARKNQELRFTFLNRTMLNSLSSGDILEFKLTDNPDVWFIVRVISKSSTEYSSFGDKRYSSL
ncbi:MAG: phospholipase D family protein [Candidatus ainarchaeum sp.]|nr:phospholipase D family protein [Candidatus ainarchaeum sp.]